MDGFADATSLNVCRCQAEAWQDLLPLGPTFKNAFRAPTMGHGGDLQQVHSEITSKGAGVKKDL